MLYVALSSALAAAVQPHIFMVIVDDFGWAETSYHREPSDPEISTPTIDSLVRQGVELNRHYVHMMCTPSRASFYSGRLPVHVLTQLADPCDKNGAVPRNMTGIAQVLKRGGYATHQVGKWDAGMVTPTHTPKGRGYDTSLNYFSHGNWMWTESEWLGSYDHRSDIPSASETQIVDLWNTDEPASSLNGTKYEEDIFRDRMLSILHAHDQSSPLFLTYASKLCHYPMQAPEAYQELPRVKAITQPNRRVYHAMVAFLDEQLRNITETMQQLGMWENTLMVLTSDNGGYVQQEKGGCNSSGYGGAASSDVGHGTACENGEAGANNFPLRGGKYSNFEGGIRVNAFVSGGFVPLAVRGVKLEQSIHIVDWYATFAGLAGVDPTDHFAAASGLPPIDSLDVWPLVSGASAISPRQTAGHLVTKELLVLGEYKYALPLTEMSASERGGPTYPNASTASDAIGSHTFTCPRTGCLYNVATDISEFHEISAQFPDVVKNMRAEIAKRAATIWSTDHSNDPACKVAAVEKWGGFYGPWKEV
jgi:arylsulfatase I/J